MILGCLVCCQMNKKRIAFFLEGQVMAFSFFLTVFSSDAALSEMIDDLADRVSVCGQMSPGRV